MFYNPGMPRAARDSASTPLDTLFRALSDRTRLRILNIVAGQEVCVCYFISVLRMPQSKISRHLAYLRQAGLLGVRRDGKWMHYRLAQQPAAIQRVLRATLESLVHDPVMQLDRSRLKQACCGPKSLLNILGAPLPASVN